MEKNHTIKQLPKSQMEIVATVAEEKMHEYRKKAADDISKEVKVKGFRPGHVPANVLEEYVGKEYITAHAEEIAIQRTYADIVTSEKLQVIARPQVKITSHEPLTFEAKVSVMPEVEVGDYKKIEIKKESTDVTEKEINEVLDDMKRHGTIYEDVDREAKKGDRVEIDFEGFDQEGKAVENTKSKNHPVIIGGGSLIPGFEDHIIGMKKDEEKEFDITFPKDYGKEDLQGKKLKFKIKLHRIEEPKEPEINGEFIKQMTGQEMTIEELKKDIEKNVKANKEQQSKQKTENDYLEALLKMTTVEIPDDLIDEETEYILQDMRDEITGRGLEFEKFLEQAKTTEDELRKKYRPEGEKRIKVRLALHNVMQKEGIKITDEEIKAEFDKVKSFYPEEQHAKVQQDFDKGELQTQIANRLAIRQFFKKVLG